MRLIELIQKYDRRIIIPLMGYPGSKLTNTTLKQNEFNWGIQFWSISELAETLFPDAIFFMMDLSVESGALGLPIRYPLEESPTVEEHLIKTSADLEKYLAVDILKDARVNVFLNTMKLMVENLDTSIMKGGYCIGPFTLTGLLMGASEAAITIFDNPGLIHEVLNVVTHVITRYAVALVDQGADLIAILEPSAVFLSPQQFTEFSGAYVKKIVRAIHAIPILHICGDTTHLIERMCKTGVQGLSLDSMVNFVSIAPKVNPNIALIGNLDPVRVLRNLTAVEVAEQTKRFLHETKGIKNLIVSTGCDLPQDTPLENIKAMIDETKKFKLM